MIFIFTTQESKAICRKKRKLKRKTSKGKHIVEFFAIAEPSSSSYLYRGPNIKIDERINSVNWN